MTNITQVTAPDIESEEGLQELEEKLKDLKLAHQEKYLNAPETLEQAIQRIMEVEMRLEDLARAVEIAEITGQLNMVEGFRREADECLKTKITIDRPLPTETMKITLITNEKENS